MPRRLSWYKYQCRPQVREGGSAEVSVLVQVPVQVPRTSEESTNYFRHRVAKCGTEQVPSPAPLARGAVNERGRPERKGVRPGTKSPPKKTRADGTGPGLPSPPFPLRASRLRVARTTQRSLKVVLRRKLRRSETNGTRKTKERKRKGKNKPPRSGTDQVPLRTRTAGDEVEVCPSRFQTVHPRSTRANWNRCRTPFSFVTPVGVQTTGGTGHSP